MGELTIRRARDSDLPAINKLLYEVHKVHSDARPDLFKAGAKKYTDEELRAIIAEDRTPVFVAEARSASSTTRFSYSAPHSARALP